MLLALQEQDPDPDLKRARCDEGPRDAVSLRTELRHHEPRRRERARGDFNYDGLVELAHLPGGDLVQKGLEDLKRGRVTAESLLVSIGFPRLRPAGLAIGEALPDPEHRLYEILASNDPHSAHSRYNALLGRLTSFENAIECEH